MPDLIADVRETATDLAARALLGANSARALVLSGEEVLRRAMAGQATGVEVMDRLHQLERDLEVYRRELIIPADDQVRVDRILGTLRDWSYRLGSGTTRRVETIRKVPGMPGVVAHGEACAERGGREVARMGCHQCSQVMGDERCCEPGQFGECGDCLDGLRRKVAAYSEEHFRGTSEGARKGWASRRSGGRVAQRVSGAKAAARTAAARKIKAARKKIRQSVAGARKKVGAAKRERIRRLSSKAARVLKRRQQGKLQQHARAISRRAGGGGFTSVGLEKDRGRSPRRLRV